MNPYASSFIAVMQASGEEVWRGHTRRRTDLLAHEYEDNKFNHFVASQKCDTVPTAPADQSTLMPPVVSYGVTVLTKREGDYCAKSKVTMTRGACRGNKDSTNKMTARCGEDKEEQEEYNKLERFADDTGDALWAARTDLVPKPIHILIESGDDVNNNVSTRRNRVTSADTAITEALTSSLNATLKDSHHLGFAAIGSNASPRPVTIAPKRVSSTGATVPSYVFNLQTRIVKDLITAEEVASRDVLYSDEESEWKHSICLAHAAEMADLIERRAMRNAQFRLEQMRKRIVRTNTEAVKSAAAPSTLTPSPTGSRSTARKERGEIDYEDSDHADEEGEMHQAGLIFLEELAASQKFLVDGIARAVKKKDTAKRNQNRESNEAQQQPHQQQPRDCEGDKSYLKQWEGGGARVPVREKMNGVASSSSAAASPLPPREWPQRERIVLRSRLLSVTKNSSSQNEREEERFATRATALSSKGGSYLHEAGSVLPPHKDAGDRGQNGGSCAATTIHTNDDLLAASAQLRNRKSDVLEGHADRSCEALRKLTISTPARRKMRLVTTTTCTAVRRPLLHHFQGNSSSSSMNHEEVLVSATMSGDDDKTSPTTTARSHERFQAKVNINVEENNEVTESDCCDASRRPPQQQQKQEQVSFQQPYQEHWNSPYSPCPLRVKGLLFDGEEDNTVSEMQGAAAPSTSLREKGARRDEDEEGQEHTDSSSRRKEGKKVVAPQVIVSAAGVEERLVALRFKPMPPPPPPLRCTPCKNASSSSSSKPLGGIGRRADESNPIVRVCEGVGTTEREEEEKIMKGGHRTIDCLGSNEVEATSAKANVHVPVRTYGWIQQSASGLNLRCEDNDKSMYSTQSQNDKRAIGVRGGGSGRVDSDATCVTILPLASPRNRRPQTSALGALSARLLPPQLLHDNKGSTSSYCSSPRGVVLSASPASLIVHSARLDTRKGRLPAYVPCSK